jgi:hypothetical protein
MVFLKFAGKPFKTLVDIDNELFNIPDDDLSKWMVDSPGFAWKYEVLERKQKELTQGLALLQSALHG